ncbi:hypothetical protein [Elstera sp.]|jgi:hypothetical protein|uniref:hypothetical protein n=1 Tax=Elstera sp. TaxID=1916664 RepID=UPI0037BEBD68
MISARIIGLGLALLCSPTVLAQTWSEPTTIPAAQSPLELKLVGWGKEKITRARQAIGKTDDSRGDSYFHSVFYQTSSYQAYVGFHEAAHFVQWEQNTIQNIAKRFFDDPNLEFGSYIDVDHGRADFRTIPLSFSKNGTPIHCWAFRSYWDRYQADGFLCGLTGKPIPDSTIRTFITHFSYKTALEPKDEGMLPTP